MENIVLPVWLLSSLALFDNSNSVSCKPHDLIFKDAIKLKDQLSDVENILIFHSSRFLYSMCSETEIFQIS